MIISTVALTFIQPSVSLQSAQIKSLLTLYTEIFSKIIPDNHTESVKGLCELNQYVLLLSNVSDILIQLERCVMQIKVSSVRTVDAAFPHAIYKLISSV